MTEEYIQLKGDIEKLTTKDKGRSLLKKHKNQPSHPNKSHDGDDAPTDEGKFIVLKLTRCPKRLDSLISCFIYNYSKSDIKHRSIA